MKSQKLLPPVLIEKSITYLYIEWKSAENTDNSTKELTYELQIKSEDDQDWISLSSSIQSSRIKKKNLIHDKKYLFRVRFKLGVDITSDWSNPSDEFKLLDNDCLYVDPPVLDNNDGTAVILKWNPINNTNCDGYKFKYREDTNNFTDWIVSETIVKGNVLKKKNLLSGKKYCFSILPIIEDKITGWSIMSSPISIPTLPLAFVNILPKQLQSKSSPINVNEVLPGKILLFYFSAHWCGPCRQFTPQLSQWYKSLKSSASCYDFEVIFVSCDHDESEFTGYYKEHPWLAVRYNDNEREMLSSQFKVNSIPRLVVMSATGKVISENYVGSSLDIGIVEKWKSTQ